MPDVLSKLVRLALVAVTLSLVAAAGHATDPLPALPTARLDPAELVQTISTGERVDIASNLREGRWTIIQFESDWCGSCRALKPSLMTLIHKKASVALRRIDIRAWDSAVARQHAIDVVPQLHLYDGTRLISADRHEVMDILRQ